MVTIPLSLEAISDIFLHNVCAIIIYRILSSHSFSHHDYYTLRNNNLLLKLFLEWFPFTPDHHHCRVISSHKICVRAFTIKTLSSSPSLFPKYNLI